MTPTKIYLDIIERIPDRNNILVNIETYISLFVLKFIDSPETIEIYLVETFRTESLIFNYLTIDITDLNCYFISDNDFKLTLASNCLKPVLCTNGNYITAGLCGILRQIILTTNCHLYLLGFKNGCLLAPTETSTWTRFCEIDIIECLKSLLSCGNVQPLDVPNELITFESHMRQPVRVHNIYKLARELAKLNVTKHDTNNRNEGKIREPRINKKKKKNDSNILSSSTPITELNLNHRFAEGTSMTLADIILYPCILISFHFVPQFVAQLPFTNKWLQSMQSVNSNRIEKLRDKLWVGFSKTLELTENVPNIIDIPLNVSLYKNDQKRLKSENGTFTKQINIERSLEKINRIDPYMFPQKQPSSSKLSFNWEDIPFDALPEGGSLPPSRCERKKHQLQSLINYILMLTKPNQRIVDFCSGSGHLGIIVAQLLPKAHVIFVENKKESLQRATDRCVRLNLTNVTFVQSNLDYFCGQFDIGTSLHACGVATDIVLQKCIEARASFVCCPCCYGGIHELKHITYPRSRLFHNGQINSEDFMYVAHCADQTHDIDKGICNAEKSKQGELCMDLIDSDRLIYARENHYTVVMTRLYPEKCTPKNRLLIGTVLT